MAEVEREEFLATFATNPEHTLVGFALMGGIFGEGIDLIGDRLSGAVVVGVGLPQIGLEREIIRAYYEAKNQQGYEFSYMYPGFNKVLQAVGRVIRTEEDRGIVLLIDDRFSRYSYKKLFPEEWKKVRYVVDVESICKAIEDFWAEPGSKGS
jgi:Rad3-related DNA helicase